MQDSKVRFFTEASRDLCRALAVLALFLGMLAATPVSAGVYPGGAPLLDICGELSDADDTEAHGACHACRPTPLILPTPPVVPSMAFGAPAFCLVLQPAPVVVKGVRHSHAPRAPPPRLA
ncbi:hypothetical protein [Devosia sediminis]|uniref:DUF2946 domain-containing protein n=1 Tax=Devosia sediminis TaxID=2798801 RepID=A0A934IYS8_9HYPH|nr:hypothetical protein [Devosia sediminis]MBJ3784700.1 hypothetical protein [Devosia sediminis]